MPPAVVHPYFSESESVHFDTLQFFSGQNLLSAQAFLIATQKAQHFPLALPTRITLNHFTPTPTYIRHVHQDDLAHLLSLEQPWKLAWVLQGKAAPSLLDSYHAERRPVAKTLFTMNNKISKVVFRDPTWQRLWRIAPKYLLKYDRFNQKEIRLISQHAIAYQQHGKPMPRLPALRTPDHRSVYDALCPHTLNLILWDEKYLKAAIPTHPHLSIITVEAPSPASPPLIGYLVRPDSYVLREIHTQKGWINLMNAMQKEDPLAAICMLQ